jgi:antirestriction protein ArdC
MNNSKIKRRSAYSKTTQCIIDKLRLGVIPWKQAWGKACIPRNLLTLKPYSGINLSLLTSFHFKRNFFLTVKQIKELKAQVHKGEKGLPIISFKWIEFIEDSLMDVKKKPFVHHHIVYNVDQCYGIPQNIIPNENVVDVEPLQLCRQVIDNMPQRPPIKHGGLKAYYDSHSDLVHMPEIKFFPNKLIHHTTLLRELVHSTGHRSRLNRKLYNTDSCEMEEIIGQLGTFYFQSLVGIKVRKCSDKNNDTQKWLKKIQDDDHFMIYAGKQAQEAVDFILNKIWSA